MRKMIVAASALAVVIVVAVVVSAFFVGNRLAVTSLSVARVTPAQIASAMKDDHFYSDYNERTLIVAGTVRSLVTQNGHLIAELDTGSTFRVLCDLDPMSAHAAIGDRLTVVAEGAEAQRQSSAVLLKGCTVP